jgi:hypothetical protein
MAMLQERAVSVEGDTTMASQKATSRRHENNVLNPKLLKERCKKLQNVQLDYFYQFIFDE